MDHPVQACPSVFELGIHLSICRCLCNLPGRANGAVPGAHGVVVVRARSEAGAAGVHGMVAEAEGETTIMYRRRGKFVDRFNRLPPRRDAQKIVASA